MNFMNRPAARFLLVLLALAIAGPAPAEAVEYRLRIVSLYEEAFDSYLGMRAPASLARIESALDGEGIPSATVLHDRWAEPVDPEAARAFGATPAKLELTPNRKAFLPELRWEGAPGGRTVWVIEGRSYHTHELARVALRGSGALRDLYPRNAALRLERARAVAFPRNFIDFWIDRTELWTRWVSRYLDMSDGIGAVVGLDLGSPQPDRVYVVIDHPQEPRTFKALLAWRKRRPIHDNLYEQSGDVGVR